MSNPLPMQQWEYMCLNVSDREITSFLEEKYFSYGDYDSLLEAYLNYFGKYHWDLIHHTIKLPLADTIVHSLIFKRPTKVVETSKSTEVLPNKRNCPFCKQPVTETHTPIHHTYCGHGLLPTS